MRYVTPIAKPREQCAVVCVTGLIFGRDVAEDVFAVGAVEHQPEQPLS